MQPRRARGDPRGLTRQVQVESTLPVQIDPRPVPAPALCFWPPKHWSGPLRKEATLKNTCLSRGYCPLTPPNPHSTSTMTDGDAAPEQAATPMEAEPAPTAAAAEAETEVKTEAAVAEPPAASAGVADQEEARPEALATAGLRLLMQMHAASSYTINQHCLQHNTVKLNYDNHIRRTSTQEYPFTSEHIHHRAKAWSRQSCTMRHQST